MLRTWVIELGILAQFAIVVSPAIDLGIPKSNLQPGLQGISKEVKRRTAFADAHYGTADRRGSQTDRGKVYIALGPPDKIRKINKFPNGGNGYPIEDWIFRRVAGIGEKVRIRFLDTDFKADYKIIPPPEDQVEATRRYQMILDRMRLVSDSINR